MKKAEIFSMQRIRGFTLLELMITLVVVAVILGLAVPSFQTTIAKNAVKSATRDLVATLNTARAQSMSSRTPVTVTPESGGWNNGWTLAYGSSVESGETYVPSSKVRISSSITSLTFRPQGGLSAPASSLTVCHADSSIPGRKITVSFLGRVSTEEVTTGC
ncbi:GspH/FimT family pseudopilin [Halopseudomonas salegens]|uniref:Type II secretion system protein H n=1 Tax=Halopseudomonas salegens TaxID=1434072 RepID=A0A1H2EBC7_9GAMM|nr:GspH/FimT family pseudopilin [Halopseudomonas salegens]SDT92441.1 type IV fimbrial biogenesis protein FimT [Halopseudomonas salegens]